MDALRPLIGGGGRPGRLRLTIGPNRLEHLCTHWSGDDFVFAPPEELASPGSLSLARFDPAAGTLWLEVYDADHNGLLRRLA